MLYILLLQSYINFVHMIVTVMIFASGEYSELTYTGQRRLEGSTRDGRKEGASRAVMATIFELSLYGLN